LNAGHNFHQGTFAGAIFTHDGQHFAAIHGDRHIVERAYTSKPLRNVPGFKKRR
jgi:hypothetical protein